MEFAVGCSSLRQFLEGQSRVGGPGYPCFDGFCCWVCRFLVVGWFSWCFFPPKCSRNTRDAENDQGAWHRKDEATFSLDSTQNCQGIFSKGVRFNELSRSLQTRTAGRDFTSGESAALVWYPVGGKASIPFYMDHKSFVWHPLEVILF